MKTYLCDVCETVCLKHRLIFVRDGLLVGMGEKIKGLEKEVGDDEFVVENEFCSTECLVQWIHWRLQDLDITSDELK